jgi:hypothetical protein
MALKSAEFARLWPGRENAELDVFMRSIVDLANDLKAKYDAAVVLINELKTDLSAHTHGGVTTGSGYTSVGATIISPDAVVTAVASVVDEI